MLKRTKEEEESQKSRLQKLQERLYSQNNPTIFRDRRGALHQNTTESVTSEWQEIKPFEEPEYVSPIDTRRTFSKFSHIIFYTAFLFFFGAISFTGYHFLFGSKNLSPDTIIVSVEAPSFINGGETFPVQVNITNLNKAPLEKVDVIIEYPKGESITSKEDAELKRVPVGDIESGSNGKGTAEIVLYGREGNQRDIIISLEYYAPGSSTILKKEVVHNLTLKAAPVVLTTDLLKEVSSNSEILFTTHIRAERGIDLNNFLLTVVYPNGFQFISSEPPARFGNNVWKFDSIKKGQVVDVTVRGLVRGEDGDEKVFRVSGGAPDRSNDSLLGIVYADMKSSLVVQKPFIGLRGYFDGARTETGEFAIRAGERTTGFFEYQNNIADTINNVVVTAKLTGEILNRQRITVSGGFYDSSKNTLIWDRSTTQALASLLPGQKGSLRFQLESYPLSAKQQGYFSQPQIKIEGFVRGQRLSDTSVPEQSSASSPLVVNIITEAGIRTELLGADAPNGGSAVEKAIVEKKSTYTISIGILNRSSTLSNPKVSFTLPPNVNLTSMVDPKTENVTYDKESRIVTWTPDVILPDTGFGRPQKKVYIGIEYIPSLIEKGTRASLTSELQFLANDTFSGSNIKSTSAGIITPFTVE